MPELPEVETVRRGIEPHVIGRVIVDAAAFDHPKFTPALDAIGSEIVGTARRGKFLLLQLDDERELVVHLGMTGALLTRASGSDRPPSPYRRASWDFDDGTGLDFEDTRRFGRLRVVPAGDYADVPTLVAMGPEPLEGGFTIADFHRRLQASRRPIKTQLLSQRPVAGVGNIYADEALWLARINPSARSISRARAERLRGALIEVLDAGVRHGGTTLRDYRGADGSAGEHQRHLHCYGRAGEPCSRCGAVLRRKVIDARSTTWCAVCQKR